MMNVIAELLTARHYEQAGRGMKVWTRARGAPR
jgi:hypothetical protein